MKEIKLDPPDDLGRRLWSGVADLVALLPPDWVLVGGLMMQLHAVELGVEDVRVTHDVDVLGQARPRGALDAIDAALLREGFVPDLPDLDGYAHRYVREGLIVDVRAPDGITPRRPWGPGAWRSGSPAVRRRSSVRSRSTVRVGRRTFTLSRPTLLGAILIKARSLMVHHDLESQREDLMLLLSLAEDPRAMAHELRKSERAWLRNAEGRLAFDQPTAIGADRTRRARLALRPLLNE